MSWIQVGGEAGKPVWLNLGLVEMVRIQTLGTLEAPEFEVLAMLERGGIVSLYRADTWDAAAAWIRETLWPGE